MGNYFPQYRNWKECGKIAANVENIYTKAAWECKSENREQNTKSKLT